MNRVLAAIVVLGGVIAPVTAGLASTPDDALVARIVEKAIDPKIWNLRPERAQAYFGGLLHFEKVGKGPIGQDPCAEGFKVKEPWPTLSFSPLDFGNDACDGGLPFNGFQFSVFGQDAPRVRPVLNTLRKALGPPTAEQANHETHAATSAWRAGERVVIVEYDLENEHGFTLKIVKLPIRDGEQ